MRDCLNSRSGFDRVLMAVAATFLTVSAPSAMAQDQGRRSAAELAIDAAIPRPEPANVPPPTASDFKIDSTASAPPPSAKLDTPTDSKPADVATAPAADTKIIPTAPATAAAPPAAPEPAKAASNIAPADQPVAEKLKDALAAKTLRYFDRRGERAAVEKFYGSRDYAPLWTQSGGLTENARGAIARLKDAAS